MNNPIPLFWWNTSQTFPSASREVELSDWPSDSMMGYKAALWDADVPHIVLGASRLSQSVQEWRLVPNRQRRLELPPSDPSSTWSSSETWSEIIRSIPSQSGVTLAPAVWTQQTERILGSLPKFGIEANSEVCSSHGRIFNWNTRTGMRGMFLSIPELSEFCVPSLICHDVRQVQNASRRLQSNDIVVKSNFSMGGNGILQFGPQKPFSFEELEKTYQRDNDLENGKGSKMSGWSWHDEPYLLECFVGDPKSNFSVTVDALIHSPTEIILVGLSQQVLSRSFNYMGVTSFPRPLEPIRHKIIDATNLIGSRLVNYGYRGYFNVDFGVTKELSVFLCDLNIRRSAPLDVHMVLRRLSGRLSRIPFYWNVDEFETTVETEIDLRELLKQRGWLFDGTRGVLPLSSPASTGFRRSFSVLVIGNDEVELRELIDAIQQLCNE